MMSSTALAPNVSSSFLELYLTTAGGEGEGTFTPTPGEAGGRTWAWSDVSTTGNAAASFPGFRFNRSRGSCDANDSDLWQLKYPVCTTRFDSFPVFVLVAAVLTFVSLWTVLGNVLVLVAICKYRALRTMSNCLIGNLAISDLLLAVTVLPISTTNDLLGFWVFGDVMCTVWLCVDVLYCTASVWGLCTVAFDRYMATVYPVWYHDQRSVKKAVGCVVFVWIFSIVISFAPFIGWQHMIPSFFTFNRDINRHECILFMSSSYVIYSSVGSFVIPTCLMTFMYIRIFNVLRRQSRNMKKKVQARPAQRLTVTNGCPTIRVPGGDEEDAVVRDFTTTTLVSISTNESPTGCNDGGIHENHDNHENPTSERERHLSVPRLSLHSSEEPCPGRSDNDFRLEEKADPSKDGNPMIQNGNSQPLIKTRGFGSPLAQKGSVSVDASLINCKLLAPDRPPASQKRSNSVCAVPGEARPPASPNHLSIADLERRNSHEGTVHVQGLAGAERPVLLKPVGQRSKSANVLTSSEDEGIPLSSQKPRRSLPCDLSKLGRNKKMTLSMKRRFELREQRATKRMLLIMACFCVCWMPFVVMYITRSLCHDCHMNTHLVAAIIWLGYANSSLNPILYSLFNEDFKSAFKRLVGIKSPRPRKRR